MRRRSPTGFDSFSAIESVVPYYAHFDTLGSIDTAFYTTFHAAFYARVPFRSDNAFQYSGRLRMGELGAVGAALCGLRCAVPRCELDDDARHLVAFS